MNKKIAIIGAGLTGLTLAYHLQKNKFNCTIFDCENRVGGAIGTEQKNGFLIETGPSTGLMGTPEMAELIAELKCNVDAANQQAKFRWIWKNNNWQVLPNSLLSGIRTPLFSFSDKLRLLVEPFKKPGNNPNETLADLVRRRMGKSFLDYAIDPFVLGIYSGNPEKLITQYAFPKLYNLEQKYGSFIGGSIKKAKEKKTEREKKATRETFSLCNGLSELINSLAEQVGRHNIKLNAQNLKVSKQGETYLLNADNVSNEEYDIVISTVGAWSLPDLFPFFDAQKLEKITSLPYAKVVQVSVGFNSWKGKELKAFGGLIPSVENRKILGALFLSSFLEGRAPKGGALLSVFLGGERNPQLINKSDAEIETILKEELMQLFGLEDWQPNLIDIRRHAYAIPQYGIESESKLKAITDLENEHKGLILAGNLRNGISMSDRVKQAYDISMQIIAEHKA